MIKLDLENAAVLKFQKEKGIMLRHIVKQLKIFSRMQFFFIFNFKALHI